MPENLPHDEPGVLRADVLVVGAGVIGASCAYQLAAAGHSVIVVDMFDGPAEGSSGRSFASVRAQWADSLNIELSWRSIRVLRDFSRDHGVDIGYRPSGYLCLVPEDAWARHLAAVELQHSHGVPVDVLTASAATAITPFDTDGIAGATWGSADGVVDPSALASAYLTMSRALGARVLFRHLVSAVSPDDATGGWATTSGGTTIRSQYLVNAAGGWARELGALAGIDVPVDHVRRNIYATAPGASSTPVPMTIDFGTGCFLRSEGERLLFGRARDDEPAGYNLRVDWPWMEATLDVAVPRFPWLADLPLDRSACWAGTYENTPDRHAILGPDPGAATWIHACGFSGHGVMQSPEVGRLVAEHVATGAITSLDVTSLGIARFGDTAVGSDLAWMVF